jgi:hypothetical protein
MPQSAKLPIQSKPQVPADVADSVPASLVGMFVARAEYEEAFIAKIERAYNGKDSGSVCRQQTAHTPNVGYEGDVSASAHVVSALGRPPFFCTPLSFRCLRVCSAVQGRPSSGEHPESLVLPLKLVASDRTVNHRQHERQQKTHFSRFFWGLSLPASCTTYYPSAALPSTPFPLEAR